MVLAMVSTIIMMIAGGMPLVESTTTECVVSTFDFSLQRFILSPNGTLGAGPYVYNATTQSTGAPLSSSIGAFSFVAYRFGTTDSAAFTNFNFTGNYTVSDINGTSGDSFSGNYTGSGNGSPATLVLAGTVGAGTGKYAGAIGAISLNGTQTGKATSPTTSSGNGTYLLVAAIVLA